MLTNQSATGPASNQEAAPDAPVPVLEAKGITKSFGDRFANDHVDLSVGAGEIRALLGENGAGKTTLISILCGQYRPDAGHVVVRGHKLSPGSPRAALQAGIGVVHQDFRLVPRFTVTENVVLGTSASGGRKAEKDVAARARAAGFGLDPCAPTWTLSVGELQQVAILKLLYRGLDILILDEPTAVLSPQQASDLFRSMRQLAANGKSIIFITHRLREVSEVADQVTILRDGRVVADRGVTGLDQHQMSVLMVGAGDADRVVEGRSRAVGESLLELKSVTVEGRGVKALDEVDIAVRRNEIVGIAGISGNGQTALAEVAAGIVKPVSGRRTCSADALAYIPEDRLNRGLVGTMSIADNLAFRQYRSRSMSHPLWLWTGRISALARRLIAAFNIPTNRPASPVAELSGGGLQRVLLARELSEEPDLIIAAQPTRGLDVASAAMVREQLVGHRDRGAGVMLISEDLDEVLDLSDRVLVMFKGAIVAEYVGGKFDRAEIGLRMGGAGAA
ncbi:MAG: ABC transporter ATP-binding protein [Candidatus Dormibacteraeota bacterium]|nr:ABC transporter ATP-binding protein [Candidatus Dormibacteraeota bacterium]